MPVARTPRVSTRVRRTSPRQGPRPPEHLVERMVVAVIGLVNAFTDRLMREIMPELRERFGARADSVWHADADPFPLDDIGGQVALGEQFLRTTFHAVDRQAANDLARAVPVPANSLLRNSAQLEQAWIHNNTELIKLESRARAEVRAVISGPLREGVRPEEVAKKIEERLGVVRSRAEFIARDQTLKLYGQIQEERQQDAGIEEYTWSSSEDERVRESHAALDGTTQRWDSPPVVDPRTGRREHPGGDYQCRCAAIPILPTGDLEPESGLRDPRPGNPPEPEDEPVSEVRPSIRVPAPEPGPTREELERAAEERAREREAARVAAEQERLAAEQEAARLAAEREAAERARRAVERQRELEAVRLVEAPIDFEEPRHLWPEFERISAEQLRKIQPDPSIETPELRALSRFTLTDYAPIRALQQGATIDDLLAHPEVFGRLDRKGAEEIAGLIEPLARAQEAMAIDNPTRYGPLFRGLGLSTEVLADWLAGTSVEFKAATNSSSYNFATAYDFATARGDPGRVVLRFEHLDRGTPVGFKANINRSEMEVFVGSGRYDIVGKTYDKAKDIYMLDLVQSPKLDAKDPPPDKASDNATGEPRYVLPSRRESKFGSDGSDVRVIKPARA